MGYAHAMPIYDYLCTQCGPFTAMRKLADFQQPSPCPVCQQAASRALVVPRVLPRSQRQAAAEPNDNASYKRLAHQSGCACCK
jgi:putative FmdB family regulatory protein